MLDHRDDGVPRVPSPPLLGGEEDSRENDPVSPVPSKFGLSLAGLTPSVTSEAAAGPRGEDGDPPTRGRARGRRRGRAASPLPLLEPGEKGSCPSQLVKIMRLITPDLL